MKSRKKKSQGKRNKNRKEGREKGSKEGRKKEGHIFLFVVRMKCKLKQLHVIFDCCNSTVNFKIDGMVVRSRAQKIGYNYAVHV